MATRSTATMDEVLSVFIAKTSCEPGFARDLLNHHNGNLGQALKTYYRMKDIIVDGDEDDVPTDDSTKTTIDHFSCSSYPGNGTISEEVSLVTSSTTTNNNKEINNLIAIQNKCSSEPSLSSQSSDVCDSSIIASSPSKLTFHFPREEVNFLEKKLSRGISRAADNVTLVSKARSEFAQDFQISSRGSRLLNVDGFLETPDFTFTLPDISVHQTDFCDFLRRDLIEKSTLLSLESSKRLNWWSDIAQNLYPLVTSGDGNCLLHAASLGMWGFHDRGLTLRRAMYMLLSKSPYTPIFYRRWRWQTHFQNMKTGLTFTESEWKAEWENILRMASTEPRSKKYGDDMGNPGNSTFELSGGKKEPNEYEEKSYIYESLEEIHIFVLAHVLRRPIIIIADTMLKDLKGEAFFPIPFGGIYLPFECSDGGLKKSPLCLTYDAAHFSALVAMKKERLATSEENKAELPFAIPLMDVDHNVLPLHFSIDPGEDVFLAASKAATLTNGSSSQSSTVSVETMFDNLAKSFVLTEQDKIELLKKYFDIVSFSHLKANCIAQTGKQSPTAAASSSPAKTPATSTSKVVTEKSQTLPSNFGRKASDFSDVQTLMEGGKGDEKSKTLSRKSSARAMLQKPFLTFGRMSKRIKKNIGQLARRSTSFRLGKTSDKTTSATTITTTANTQSDKLLVPTSSSAPSSSCITAHESSSSSSSSSSSTSSAPGTIEYTESIINTDNSVFYCDTNVLAAKLHVNKHHSYYDDMIKNYLNTARVRFFNEKRAKKLKEAAPSATTLSSACSSSTSSSSSSSASSAATSTSSSLSLDTVATTAAGTTTPTTTSTTASLGQTRCAGLDCTSPASAATHFLCASCFEEQKKTMERNYGPKVTSSSLTVPMKIEGPPSSRLTLEDRKMVEGKTSSKYSPKLSHYSSTTAKEVILEEEASMGYDGSSEKLKSLYSPDSPLLKDRNPLHTHREFCIPSSL